MILVNHPRTIIKDDKSKFIASKVYSSTAKSVMLKDVYWISIFSLHLWELLWSFTESLLPMNLKNRDVHVCQGNALVQDKTLRQATWCLEDNLVDILNDC